MREYMLLPGAFLKFWFIEAPLIMIKFFVSLNQAFFQLFSLSLFLKTFFKPLKNEYRPGLVRFSIIMGIVVKTVFILVDLLLFSLLLSVELISLIVFLIFPFVSLILLIMPNI